MMSDIRSGVRYVLGDSRLRSIAGCTGTSNLFGSALFGIFPVLIWRELELPPAFYGTVIGLASVGFLAGALLSSRLPGRFGLGPTIIASAAFSSPAFLLMTLTPAPLLPAALCLSVGWFVVGFTQVVYNVAQVSLRQSITPQAMQSRMNATMRFIVWGTIPIGSLMGGLLATWFGVREALVVAALGSFTATLWVYFSPLRDLRDMPGLGDSAGSDRAEGMVEGVAAGQMLVVDVRPDYRPEPEFAPEARSPESGSPDPGEPACVLAGRNSEG